jgi:hypothetical protein
MAGARAVTAVVMVMISLPALARGRGHGGSVHVKASVTRNGTFVPAHTRTGPDRSRGNNWSTKGNVNPTTGREGAKPMVK